MQITEKLSKMTPSHRTDKVFKHFKLYMEDLIKETAAGVLSPRSLDSIFYRMKNPIENSMVNGEPTELLTYLGDYLAQMSVIATYSDVSSFWGWCIMEQHIKGANTYALYRQRHKRKSFFKAHAAPLRDLPSVKKAEALIKKLDHPMVRRKALELLATGMRWTESLTLKDGIIIGKGLKPRKITLPKIKGPQWKGHYDTFRKVLAQVDLKPHDLRKIYATHLAKVENLNAYQIQKRLGHASILTSQRYVNMEDE